MKPNLSGANAVPFCFRIVVLALMPALFAFHAYGEIDNTIPTQLTVSGGKGSKLWAHERAVVQATDCGNPDSTEPNCNLTAAQFTALISPASEDAAQCRSINNTSALTYFVPWATPLEWGKFLAQLKPDLPAFPKGKIPGLSVHKCCPPLVGNVCANQLYTGANPLYANQYIGNSGIEVNSPSTGAPIQLGQRVLGRRTVMLPDYGAQDDVTAELDAAALLNDNTINYKVTYVCDADRAPGGDPWADPLHGWVRTFERGSCSPMDGECSHNLPTAGLPALPSDLQLLCTKGSVLKNLVDHGTYWTWECEGTPGLATAFCALINTTTSSGNADCGTAHENRVAAMPSTTAELCTSGIPTAVSGTGANASPWTWSCDVATPPSANCLSYQTGAQIDGVCGTSGGYVTNDPNWNPGTGPALCANGTRLLPPGVTVNYVDTLVSGWTWTCAGENGGNDKICAATLSNSGRCNSSVHNTAGTTSPMQDDTVLCSQGQATPITPGPAVPNNGTIAWLWTCWGTLGTQNCQKINTNSPVTARCGTAAGTVKSSTSVLAGTQLCAAGSTGGGLTWDTASTPPQWNWTCTGAGSGSTTSCTTGNVPVDGACNVASSFIVTPFNPFPANACKYGNPATNIVTGATTITFDCAGYWGGGITHCSVKYNGGAIQGTCGYPLGAQLFTGSPPPNGSLCSSGTPANKTYDPVLASLYRWTCQGSSAAYDKNCNVFVNPQPGVCGSAQGTTRVTQPGTAALCTYGTGSAVVKDTLSMLWTWTCQGDSPTSAVSCSANLEILDPIDGVCGASHNAQLTSAPTSGLCDAGTSTLVLGNGPWSWTCKGKNGGATAACIANVPTPIGPGECGTADGTDIPTAPNTNLCVSGTPSTIIGNGPWNWNCVGTTTVACQATKCVLCEGTATTPLSFSFPILDQSITYGGACTVGGTVDFTVTTDLQNSNTPSTLYLTHTASGLTFTKTVQPVPAPAKFCPPCYRIPTEITGNFIVTKSGSCSSTNLTLNGGGTITIPITSVSLGQ